MRKLILAIVAIVTCTVAVPASAQSLGQILGSIGGGEQRSPNGFIVAGGGYYGSTTCYGNGALSQVACRLQQLEQMKRDREYQRQVRAQEQRQQFDQRARQIEALQRACQAGDSYSCQRSGGSDPRSMSIARALMDACQAGDQDSCQRSRQMLDGGRTEYAYRR